MIFLFFFLLLLLQQSELVWSDLKWLSNPGASLCPEKTCVRYQPSVKIGHFTVGRLATAEAAGTAAHEAETNPQFHLR